MDAKTIAILAAAGVGVYFLTSNREKKNNTNADNAINNNSEASSQAQKLYSNLNVTSTAGRFHISLSSLHPNVDQYQTILNIGLKITDLKTVNSTFLALTNNQYTLTQATSDAMSSDFYSLFWNYAKSQKVISTETQQVNYFQKTKDSTTTHKMNVNKKSVLGSYLSKDKNNYFTVLNSVTLNEEGWFDKTIKEQERIEIYVNAALTKIVNPS